MSNTKYTITFGKMDKDMVFKSRAAAKRWIVEGLFGTEGAESEHYASLLGQLAEGRTVLDYWAC